MTEPPGFSYGAGEIQPAPYAVFYFKLFDANGEDYIIHAFQIPTMQIIGGLEFGYYERTEKGDESKPLLRSPFSMHGSIKSLHTICSRYDDEETEEVER